MTAMEVGTRLVELCRAGKNMDAIQALYDKDIVSVEAAPTPGMPQEVRGIETVRGKNQLFSDNNTVHSEEAMGPYPHGDRFAVRFAFDVTPKETGKRAKMDEVALYSVKN